MTISSINQQNNHQRTLKEQTITYGRNGLALGVVAGGIEGLTRKSWLKGKNPSDKFEKKVVENLEKTLPKDEYGELKKIQKFFSDITDAEVPVDDFKKQINNCKELKNAIPRKANETADQAVENLFAEKDTTVLKQKLMNLQANTTTDKKVNKNVAKDLINNNFDSDKKALKKAAKTSEEMFKILKKSANHIKYKSAVIDTMIGAFIGGVGGMLIGSSTHKNS